MKYLLLAAVVILIIVIKVKVTNWLYSRYLWVAHKERSSVGRIRYPIEHVMEGGFVRTRLRLRHDPSRRWVDFVKLIPREGPTRFRMVLSGADCSPVEFARIQDSFRQADICFELVRSVKSNSEELVVECGRDIELAAEAARRAFTMGFGVPGDASLWVGHMGYLYYWPRDTMVGWGGRDFDLVKFGQAIKAKDVGQAIRQISRATYDGSQLILQEARFPAGRRRIVCVKSIPAVGPAMCRMELEEDSCEANEFEVAQRALRSAGIGFTLEEYPSAGGSKLIVECAQDIEKAVTVGETIMAEAFQKRGSAPIRWWLMQPANPPGFRLRSEKQLA